MIDQSQTTTLAATRIRHEPRRRAVHVVSVAQVGANSRSIVFGGEDLAGFSSLGFDDHCKFIFTDADGVEQKRDFTPRAFNTESNQLTLEFALHEGGAASDWAARAVPGSVAAIGGPKSSVVVPTAYDWHLLAGDPTAAPAIARRLGELPQGKQAQVFMFDEAGSGGREFFSRAQVTVQWFTDDDAFLTALEAFDLPAGPGFVWAAGEAALIGQVRSLFVEGKGHSRKAMRIAGYWKRGEAGTHQTLEKGLD